MGANLLLARIAFERGDLIRAKAHLRAELLMRPDSPRVILELSNLLIDVDEVRLGIACLKRLIQAEPKNVRAWQNLAVAECLRGRHDKGIDASLHALELCPTNIMVRHNLALAYVESGELHHAWDELTYALQLAPANRSLKRLQFRVRLLRILRAVGF
jgi:tetratricopeptide (TPR) repeat protein